jgi:hypothetical protein
MKLNFTVSEFNISGEPIPEDVADKILKWHILPMQRVRDKFNDAIWPSLESGYRSVEWEEKHGRNGNSQHTFKTKGAVDWTCQKFPERKNELLKLIIEETDYTRIAVYNTFIHCDYKVTNSMRRELYSSDNSSNWKFEKYV